MKRYLWVVRQVRCAALVFAILVLPACGTEGAQASGGSPPTTSRKGPPGVPASISRRNDPVTTDPTRTPTTTGLWNSPRPTPGEMRYEGLTSQGERIQFTLNKERRLRFQIRWSADCGPKSGGHDDTTRTGPMPGTDNYMPGPAEIKRWGPGPPPPVPLLPVADDGTWRAKLSTFEPMPDADRYDYEIDIGGAVHADRIEGTFSAFVQRINGQTIYVLGGDGLESECTTGPIQWTAQRL